MSDICIYIRLDDYLRQWYIHEEGGSEPVELRKGGIESKILQTLLIRQPKNEKPCLGGEGFLSIKIPEFRYKPAEVYNYLTERAERALVGVIRDRFDTALWAGLQPIDAIGRRRDDLIYAWMESCGIELTETNWNAIAKRYQRLRKLYYVRNYAEKNYQKRKKNH